MPTSFFISMLLHAALLAWTVVGIASPRTFNVVPVKTLPVEILAASEFTRIKAGKKEKPKQKTAVKPVESKKKTVFPKPEKKSTKVTPKHASPKAEPKPKPEKIAKLASPVKKRKPPKKKPAKAKTRLKPTISQKQKDFNADQIAALLNKIPDQKAAKPADKTAPSPREKISRGQSFGEDETLSLSEIDAFRQKIESCWNPPVGGIGAKRLVIKIQFSFKQDGSLASPPRVINRHNSPVFQAVAESALRAIWECQPYALPIQKYKIWKDMTLNFDPTQIYGG